MNRAQRKRPKAPHTHVVSACLAGLNCTYKGKNKLDPSVRLLVEWGGAIPVCPEVLGGLPIPRENSEISGGDGSDVLAGRAKVMTPSGRDVTRHYKEGSRAILSLAKRLGIKKAVLKANSPACGYGRIYDGSFKRALKKGDGVLAALLRRHGIKISTEKGKRP
ncbi:MAG: DUF523 domain-containing protein [Candidatus Omnitrophica bacterium]|nr:DUF523 domain-containing protein [Candidatus Omnitrophota bacterium]